MRLYALRGMAEWQRVDTRTRTRAIQWLGSDIAENPAQVSITLNTEYNHTNGAQLRFIPRPKHPRRQGFERAFFIPRSVREGGGLTVAFELFLMVSGDGCLAYRLEPAHPPPTHHGYGHVQFSRRLLRRTILPKKIPAWIPDRYPAHPLGTSDPWLLFLSMIVALHGYESGALRLIQEVYQAANSARQALVHVEKLKQLLGLP